ncbi:WD40/YVTN/BNR-like repeat-containing protein [Ferruginibacter sp. SUN106]|uniref:WD40/YVTN/BNR-like repeat-containing protein n=1 Tax=Ferruginibacter sp. SUN106 TaxID=2978348 RepID=UPI003D3690DE
MKSIFSILLFCFIISFSKAQTVQVIVSDKKTSMRGLSVVNDKVIWVSGSKGSVGKSIDGGDTFTWMTVKGFEKTDFRDIEAFDAKNAIIMGIDTPAYILKTKDGGETWDVVYENKTTGMFLDAMEFWNEMSGIVIGDPIDNKIFIARTFDGGKTWRALPDKYFPVAEKGEACFASSGSNVAALNLQEAVFITGGTHSRMFIRDKKIELPIIQGKETTGANSVGVKHVKKKTTVIIVGGDFTTKDSTTKNCCITTDGGNTFTVPVIAPHGYRSCVEFLNGDNWVTCGINGVDYSKDNGATWTWISKDGFNVCRKAKKGKAVFFAGNGKIGKLVQ